MDRGFATADLQKIGFTLAGDQCVQHDLDLLEAALA
jgi:hypothetical protein